LVNEYFCEKLTNICGASRANYTQIQSIYEASYIRTAHTTNMVYILAVQITLKYKVHISAHTTNMVYIK